MPLQIPESLTWAWLELVWTGERADNHTLCIIYILCYNIKGVSSLYNICRCASS